ncbi:MAG: hypothetical protein QM535_21055 [Limnohabitans sp.]|nr:hypothetical protein [Limnohabitans sp.]
MKRYLFTFCFLFVFIAVSAQNNCVNYSFEILDQDVQSHSASHVQFQYSEIAQPNHLSTWIISKLKANQDFYLKIIDSNTDIVGNKHFRFKQYYKDIVVDGATINLHYKGEKPFSFNGVYYPNLELDLSTSISVQEALEIAKKSFPQNSIFGWEKTALAYLLIRA